MGVHAFSVLYPGIVKADPAYFSDFWIKPGYLGAPPPESLIKARIQYRSTIKVAINEAKAIEMNLGIEHTKAQNKGTADKAWQIMQEQAAKIPVAFQLAGTPPTVDFLGGDLIIKTGSVAGKKLSLKAIQGDVVIVGVADASVLSAIKSGDEVEIDNSNFLAAQTYHRHQMPGRDFYVWDQFRTSDGQPIYPQRPMLLGPLFAANASGTVQTGKFQGR